MRKVLAGATFSIGLMFNNFSFAQAQVAPDCYDSSRVASEVQTQFKLTNNDPSLQYRYCDQKNIIFATFQALLYLKDLPAINVSNDDLDQGILGTHPYDFLTSHIQEIAFEPNGENCATGTMAYINDQLPTMHVCPWMTNFDILTNAGVLIHESRHVDGFPHVYCDHGPYRTGPRACDPSYQTKGSYGTATEFEVKVSRSSTVNGAVRVNARGFAITDFMERFNALPFGIHQGILLESADNSVGFFDGSSLSPIIGPQKDNQVFFATSAARAGFYNPDNRSIAYYQANGQLVPPAKSSLQDELDRLSTSQTESLQDIAFIGDGTCFLLAQSLHCFRIGDDNSAFDVPLNGLRVSSFVAINESRIFRDGDVYLADMTGAIFQMPVYEQLRGSDPSHYPRAVTSLDLLAIAQISSNQEIVMRSNHQLQIFDSSSNTWTSISALGGRSFKRMIGPYFWSAQLGHL